MAVHVCVRGFASYVTKLPCATRHSSGCCNVVRRAYHLRAGLEQAADKSDHEKPNPFWEKYRSKIESVRGHVGNKQDEGTSRPSTSADVAPTRSSSSKRAGPFSNSRTPNPYPPPVTNNGALDPSYSLPPVSEIAVAWQWSVFHLFSLYVS